MNNIDLYIQELETSKVEIKEAIIAKGVTPEGGLSSYAAAINSIEDPTLETDDLGVLINENGSYYYTPEGDGFTSVAVTVDVIPPPIITQEKDVTITSNGETIVTPDSGFDGLNKVNISVDVPIPTFETETLTVELTDNGTYNYTPEKDGYSSVEVTVDVTTSGGGKPKIYNGFVLNGAVGENEGNYATLKTIDFSQYDWSDVYDLSYFFGNFSGAPSDFRWSAADFANFNEHYNGKVMACKYIVNPANGTSGGYLNSTGALSFLNNRMHDCLDMSYMFYGCSRLYDVSSMAVWDTSNVLTTYYMFNGCYSLKSVPLFDTSNVTNMSYMFYDCSSLTTVPQFDTSNVTNMNSMFYNCRNLVAVPLFDTSNVTDMSNMFDFCGNLVTIPELDFSNVINMGSIFNSCHKLKELPNINCKNVTSFNSSWYTSSVEKIGIIDCDSVTNANYLFVNSTVMTDAGGFRNLGIKSSVSGTNGNYFLYAVPNLTYESLINIFNLLYDRASAGYSVLTLKLHKTQMEKLSDDDKLIAINKGWSLTV